MKKERKNKYEIKVFYQELWIRFGQCATYFKNIFYQWWESNQLSLS